MLDVVSITPLPLCTTSSSAVPAAWCSPKHKLDISILTRPPSEAFSTISLSTSFSQEGVHSRERNEPQIKKISRSKLSRARKRISWQSAGLELTKSHDSAIRAKVDGSNNKLGQCFLFSSQPRVVDTAGPISPAHRGESDSEVEDESLEAPIPVDWDDSPEKYDYLEGVRMIPFNMLQIDRLVAPSALLEEYNFSLEKKILGLT